MEISRRYQMWRPCKQLLTNRYTRGHICVSPLLSPNISHCAELLQMMETADPLRIITLHSESFQKWHFRSSEAAIYGTDLWRNARRKLTKVSATLKVIQPARRKTDDYILYFLLERLSPPSCHLFQWRCSIVFSRSGSNVERLPLRRPLPEWILEKWPKLNCGRVTESTVALEILLMVILLLSVSRLNDDGLNLRCRLFVRNYLFDVIPADCNVAQNK